MVDARGQPGEPAAYFVRESLTRFRPTSHVGGGWDPNEQHIAPSIGLLAHVIEADHAASGGQLSLTRLSCDILGTMPLESVDVEVSVLRPGRTIQLVEARMSQGGRASVVARGWLAARYDTADVAGSALATLPPRAEMTPFDMGAHWPGGFVRSVQLWRRDVAKGRVQFWLRSDVVLIHGEAVSATAHMLRLIDVANGIAAREAPEDVLYPNLDLTVHLFRRPGGELTGLDSASSFGPDGAGLTQSVIHDESGPLGTFAQTLTVRPRRG